MSRGVFAPDSAMWRINRERFVLIGGPAAAILQAAHPSVAFGVAEHSSFRDDIFRRLNRTLEAVYTVAFGTRAEVERLEARVRAIHEQVAGTHPAPYSALDPDALLWVLATLIVTSTEMHRRYAKPLAPDELERFFADMRTFGRCFGLEASHGPQTWPAFAEYYAAMIAGPLLGSHPLCAEVANAIVSPARPFSAWLLAPAVAPLACEYVPEPVRSRLRLPTRRWHAPAVRGFERTARAVLPLVPGVLRHAPAYTAARRDMSVGRSPM
jgi:uncharacterized protein (DUF2236 family)